MSASPLHYEMRVPGDPRALALVRGMVRELGMNVGLSDAKIHKIQVAVDEAVTNIIEHAYADVSPKPSIHLNFSVNERCFAVEIFDEGKAFDYQSYSPPVFPDHWHAGNTRGVGLYLIRECMDEVAYDQLQDQRNRLRLVKHL